jgi:hypothetical protein
MGACEPLPADYAFTTFLATSTRARMTPLEQQLFDFHKTGLAPETVTQMAAYAARKRKKTT